MKIMYRESERWTNGIYDCFKIEVDGLSPISQLECSQLMHSNNVKILGKNEQGFTVAELN